MNIEYSKQVKFPVCSIWIDTLIEKFREAKMMNIVVPEFLVISQLVDQKLRVLFIENEIRERSGTVCVRVSFTMCSNIT